MLYITSDAVMFSFRYFSQNSVFWISVRKAGQEKPSNCRIQDAEQRTLHLLAMQGSYPVITLNHLFH